MNFTYKNWDRFCQTLSKTVGKSVPACTVSEQKGRYFVLKHDVEADVKRAFSIAKIEKSHGHLGSYYVQAYLLKDERNVRLLQRMRDMGHEISYHYDVLDAAKGNFDAALAEYEKNLSLFDEKGFSIVTVCQHGNPIAKRIGYTSNRDFFRKREIAERFSEQSDIMVNFAEKVGTSYTYFSDAGRQFKLIYDPFFNDVIHSDDKNTVIGDLNGLLPYLQEGNAIISMHPHRWCKSAFGYTVKTAVFKLVRFFAKTLMKIPFMKKLFEKYYYLAKKI